MFPLLSFLAFSASLPVAQMGKPNIVWIVAEDISPNLGCYGDKVANTPNLDRFASEGARFTHAFTHAPVCAPSRSGLITCRYPIAIGSHHMRSRLIQPPATFTSLLRQAGYHVAWPGKTDFNFQVPKDAFDSTLDWTKGKLPKEPFFAYVNFNGTHESQIRHSSDEHAKRTARLQPEQRHDPAKMPLPPYYPDTKEVRNDIAFYHDNITAMDYQAGDVLKLLKDQGVDQRTVVFFFGDHGWGMPRGKRWVYDSGTRAPLLIRWPGKIPPGGVRQDLVAFVDFGVTALAIAGADIPPSMDGQPFLTEKARARKHVFAARDRMDETPDRIRSVRDTRFHYIRNFHPELPYAQRVQYMELMPTMQAWRRENAAEKLQGPQKLFFQNTKPKEELYDCDADPHEVRDLAGEKGHQEKLLELRSALDQWLKDTRDLGAFEERELIQRGLVEDFLKQYEGRKKQ